MIIEIGRMCRQYSVWQAVLFGALTLLVATVRADAGIAIDSIETMQKIGNDPAYPLDGSYILTQDIDASATLLWNGGTGFAPLGSSSPFIGTFDGQGHSIIGITINRPTQNNVGLFGQVGNLGTRGTVRNLTVSGGNITGQHDIGGIVGQLNGPSTLTKCFTSCRVLGQQCAGGLVGFVVSGEITLCCASGSVVGGDIVGGLIGGTVTEGESVTQCCSTGSVDGGWTVGGLIGELNGGNVTQCYATGAVSGTGGWVGGIFGRNRFNVVFSQCYAAGHVTGAEGQKGGFEGPDGTGGSFLSSYWDVQTTGQLHSGNGSNDAGESTSAMKSQATFVNWDFTNVWNIVEGQTYPFFRFLSNNFHWVLINPAASWPARGGHTAAAMNNKLWVLGGWGDVGDRRNDVWWSSDGKTWTEATANAGWIRRVEHTSEVFDNKLWVMGGDAPGYYLNDVWCSADGANWTQTTSCAGWAPRQDLCSAVFNDKLWVLGGWIYPSGDPHRGTFYNDVWSTSDGVTWMQVTASAEWCPRARHRVVVFDNRLWVMGGRDAATFMNDVWWSSDGAIWNKATDHAGWTPRETHAAVAFNNKLWVMAGGDGSQELNDMWWSSDGATWTEATPHTEWTARGLTALTVFSNKLWLLGGDHLSGHLNDVWSSSDLSGPSNYSYDKGNRLSRCLFGQGVRISYEYDPAGNRLQKTVSSPLTISVASGNPPAGGMQNSGTNRPVLETACQAAATEGVTVNSITFTASGTGSDTSAISAAKLWNDANGNGVVDNGESQVGSNATFSADNGTVTFLNLAFAISAGQTVNLLLTYDLNGTAQQGQTFSARLTDNASLIADGSVWGPNIAVLGAPVNGATLTVSTDTNPPTFAGLASATGQDGQISLAWATATDPSTPITYDIWQATASFGGVVSGPPSYTTQGAAYTVPNLVNGQEYFFVVRARDAAGNRDANVIEQSSVPQATLYTLTLTASPNGCVSIPTGATPFERNAQISLTATGDAGYYFTNWTGDVPSGADTVNPLMLVMDGNKSLTANFARSMGTVGVNVAPSTAPWSFVDGDGVAHTGPAPVLNVPTGDIQVTWLPLAGYLPPAQPVPQTLSKDGYVTFTGVYAPVLAAGAPIQNQRHYIGEMAQFTVQTSGGLGALHYQWKFDDHQSGAVHIIGDVPTLILSGVKASEAGDYWCVVTDAASQVLASNVATLGVAEPLSLTGTVPAEVQKYAGQAHSIAVTTQGGFAPLAYHWSKNGLPTGSNAAELQFPALITSDAGTYTSQVTDDLSSSVESSTSSLLVAEHLSFTTALPAQVNKHFGEYVTLQVVVSGGFQPMAYEWYKNGAKIVGADRSNLSLQNLAQGDAGTYEVQVTDGNTDVRQSSTELVLTWGMPAVGSAGLLLLVGIGLIGGSLMTKRRHHIDR